MTLNQKSLKLNYFGPALLNLCLYFFLSSVIYYLFSLNINLVKLGILFGLFILVFYLSSKKTELLLPKMNLKNIVVITKFLLGVITISAALLIYNECSLNSITLYLLVLATGVLYAVLNKAYSKYSRKQKSRNEITKINELSFRFNLEKIFIVILVAATAVIIEINIIPLILAATAIYYLLSAYVNTFQQIKY